MNTFLTYAIITIGVILIILRTADFNLNSRVEIFIKSRYSSKIAKWLYILFLLAGFIFWLYFIKILIN